MSYLNRSSSRSRRGGLLVVALAVHVGILLLLSSGKPLSPRTIAAPLLVELLPAANMHAPAASDARPTPRAIPTRQPPPASPETPQRIDAADAATPAAPPLAAHAESRPAASASAGEPLSPAIFDAAYLNNPAPRYPPLSRRSGEEGKVILRVSVNRQGSADSVEVGTSSGSPRLDDAAVSTVRHWKFIPARRGDTPVQSWVLVPITFRMEQ